MLASTPTSSSYISSSRSLRRRESSISPSIRSKNTCTPQKSTFPSPILPTYDSVMLTPSPLKHPRALFSSTEDSNLDDLFLDSPYRSPTLAYSSRPEAMRDENHGVVDLSLSPESPTPSSTFAPLMPSASSGMLYTPVKQSKTAEDSAFSRSPDSKSGLGTKRKSSSSLTPLRKHQLTPLNISSARDQAFQRLAPRAPPLFVSPRSVAKGDTGVGSETTTMGKLTLSDLDDSEDEEELCSRPKQKVQRRNERGAVLHGPGSSTKQALRRSWGSRQDHQDRGSMSNQAAKRRTRSRPAAMESTAKRNASISPRKPIHGQKTTKSIPFPAPVPPRTQISQVSTPVPPRKRTSAAAGKSNIPVLSGKAFPQPSLAPPTRAPMQRNESAATLFFGPKIEPGRSRTNSDATESPKPEPIPRPKMASRHSYGGGDTWMDIQAKSFASPESSPSLSVPSNHSDEDEDMFDHAPETSFQFSVTSGTPSPDSKKPLKESIQFKYKPRDSGIGLSDDEDSFRFTRYTLGRSSSVSIMPPSSSSASSISDYDDELVTPGVAPSFGSGWPNTVFSSNSSLEPAQSEEDVEAFIKRTLAGGAKSTKDHPGGPKKAPGTPVKRNRVFMPIERPWQSAVANKVARGPEFELPPKKGKAPRKSMPATLGRKASVSSFFDPGSDTEEEDSGSPSFHKARYPSIGLGRPSPSTPNGGHPALERTRWLMRRSSSGAFSSSSDSTSGFPTPTRDHSKLSKQSSSASSSNNSLTTVNLPSPFKIPPQSGEAPTLSCQPPDFKGPVNGIQAQLKGKGKDGRFAREFVPVDEVGSGEFGKVIKVKGRDDILYAVKISKRFEGPRHRLRLREEVDILEQLSQIARVNGQPPHPNILEYLDSWEEDEKLFIRTELCELGNFSNFLWEYGKAYARLDEPRVWKIMAALSNGLRFIHDAGIIHLDFKPANIFITIQGQFKIGDFGMASVWPRAQPQTSFQIESSLFEGSFEREGDKLYLAAEVLQGQYGKEADVFSFGMTMLETAYNIVVPGQGDAWHLLRREDFSQITVEGSDELFQLIRTMMKADPSQRPSCRDICEHPIVGRAKKAMDEALGCVLANGDDVFGASPLGRVSGGYLEEELDREPDAMDVGP